MATVARYAQESDARRRALEEPELRVVKLPSERWPEYPWAVQRDRSGVHAAIADWGERLFEQPSSNGAGACERGEPGS